MVMLHIKLKEMKNTITCSHVPMQTIVADNLFIAHFSIECNISELNILRNSWSLARPIMSFPKDNEYNRILNSFLIDPPPTQKKKYIN